MCFSLFKCKLNLLAAAAEQRPNHSAHIHTHTHTKPEEQAEADNCVCVLVCVRTIKEKCVFAGIENLSQTENKSTLQMGSGNKSSHAGTGTGRQLKQGRRVGEGR